MTSDRDDSLTPPHIVGYWCPSYPDGPLIPPRAFVDRCGGDKAVWSDGSTTDA